MKIPKVGEIWRHTTKNLDYKILNVSGRTVHSDPPEIMIHYKALYTDPIYGKNAEWYRTLNNWTTNILINNEVKPRFYKIK